MKLICVFGVCMCMFSHDAMHINNMILSNAIMSSRSGRINVCDFNHTKQCLHIIFVYVMLVMSQFLILFDTALSTVCFCVLY